MIIFVDLDGTLTHTADIKYKELKDGLRDCNPNQIPLFQGSVDFVSALKDAGHRVIILSDSHPKYVRPIVENFFNVEYIHLADKPNTAKTLSFIQSDEILNNLYQANKDEFMIIALSVVLIELLTISLIKEKNHIKTLKIALLPAFSRGVSNGLVNSLCLTLSLMMPASVMYPVSSGGGIALTAFIAVAFYREKLSSKQLIGLIFGILSVVLLSII